MCVCVERETVIDIYDIVVLVLFVLGFGFFGGGLFVVVGLFVLLFFFWGGGVVLHGQSTKK